MNWQETWRLGVGFGVVCGAAFALSGCTSTPKTAAECASTDWSRAGSRSVARGEPLALGWARVSRECVSLGFPTNKGAFEQAWGGGFAAYCAPRNALSVGRDGQGHQGICTPPLDQDFLRAYDLGRVIKVADDDFARADSALRKALAMANDEKRPQPDRANARRDANTQQSARDNAAARISSLEATAAQQGWGLGR